MLPGLRSLIYNEVLIADYIRYGMPRYQPLGRTLMKLAYNNQTGPNPAFPVAYDALCPVATLLADLLTL